MQKSLEQSSEASDAFVCITGSAGISNDLRRNRAFLDMLSLSQRPLSTPTTKAPAQTTWPNICRLCFFWKRSCKNPRAITHRWMPGAADDHDTPWLQSSPQGLVDGQRLYFHPLLCSFRVHPACLMCLPFTAGLLILGNELYRFLLLYLS